MSKSLSGTRKKTFSKKRKIRFRCGLPGASAVKEVLKERPGWTEVDAEDDSWDLFWCDVSHLKLFLNYSSTSGNTDSPRFKSLQPRQRIPHFRNHYELTRKNLLARNLKRFRKHLLKEKGHEEDAELCDSVPLSFELPSEYMMFVEEFRKNPGITWIVKPASGSQGRGIFLFQKLRDLNSIKNLRDDSVGDLASGIGTSYVVQRYIESPYLLAGRKFDLRIYALVTSFTPLKIWLAREGFARLSGSDYDLSALKDNKVHLTNVAIQKSRTSVASKSVFEPSSTNSSEAKKEDADEAEKLKHDDSKVSLREVPSNSNGVKWSLRNLRQYLTAKHGDITVEILMQRIARLVAVSLQAVQTVIIQDSHCFELYGYDVLLDEFLHPWLLEVNASPALTPTDLDDYRLKYDLVSDILNILDYEGKLTGNERRVGGFDLIWDDGPIHCLIPGADCGVICHSSSSIPTQIRQGSENSLTPRLNAFLGCLNDRSSQLHQLEEYANMWKQYSSLANAPVEQSKG